MDDTATTGRTTLEGENENISPESVALTQIAEALREISDYITHLTTIPIDPEQPQDEHGSADGVRDLQQHRLGLQRALPQTMERSEGLWLRGCRHALHYLQRRWRKAEYVAVAQVNTACCGQEGAIGVEGPPM